MRRQHFYFILPTFSRGSTTPPLSRGSIEQVPDVSRARKKSASARVQGTSRDGRAAHGQLSSCIAWSRRRFPRPSAPPDRGYAPVLPTHTSWPDTDQL